MKAPIYISTDAQGAWVDGLSYVYIHRRADNNEVFYVGIGTQRGPKYHRAYNKSGRYPHWKRITAKYGRIVEIVAEDLTRKDASDLECKLIAQYGRQDLGTGTLVNLTPGGEAEFPRPFTPEIRALISQRLKGNKFAAGNSFRKGIKHTEETIQKMREAKLGRVATEETRQKMSLSRKGRVGPNAGRTLSEEHKQKIGLAGIGRPGNNNRQVIDIKTRIRYSSIAEAAAAHGISRHALSRWLRGDIKNKSSLQFCDPNRTKKLDTCSTRGHMVINLETGIYYDSIKAAAATTKIKNSLLERYLRGICKNKTSFRLC